VLAIDLSANRLLKHTDSGDRHECQAKTKLTLPVHSCVDQVLLSTAFRGTGDDRTKRKRHFCVRDSGTERKVHDERAVERVWLGPQQHDWSN